MTDSSPQPSPSPCYQEPPDRKPSHPASLWAVAGLSGRMPRWAGKEGGRFRSDGRGLVSVLGRPAGPGGEGGGGVGTPRVVSADPRLLGTSGKPGSSIPEVPLGGSRAAGSPRYGPAASPVSPSGVEPGPSLAPRKAGALSAAWHLLASSRVTDTAPSPSSGPAEAPCGLRSKAAGCPLTLPGPPSNSEALK